MVAPSIISLGWEDYEHNADDLEYMETVGDVCWNSEELDASFLGGECTVTNKEYAMEAFILDNDYHLTPNEDIFSMLEESGEFIGNKYYSLKSQHYDSMEEEYYLEDPTVSWEEEYQLFCESETLDEESFKEDYNVVDVIKRKDKINNKRKKHNKDKKNSNWYCDCQRCQMGKQHKHLRAQKVYDASEYHYDDPSFDWDDYVNALELEDDLWYDTHDWDGNPWSWQDYTDDTGKVLETWEIRNRELDEINRAWSCEYCGQVICDCDTEEF